MNPTPLTVPVLEPPSVMETSLQKPIQAEHVSDATGSKIQPVRLGGANAARGQQAKKGVLLWMSDDVEWHWRLLTAAEAADWTLMRVAEAAETFRSLRVNRPAAVLLDLDISTGAAWETAERLLQEANCPPIILLTGRTKQPDLRLAVGCGSIVDKVTEPDGILRLAEQLLAAPRAIRAERTALQRLSILRLNPFNRPVSMPAYRDFGINE
jgi:CheY-like chemotaxis protein